MTEIEKFTAALELFGAAGRRASYDVLTFAQALAGLPRPGRCNAEKRNGRPCLLRSPCGIHR